MEQDRSLALDEQGMIADPTEDPKWIQRQNYDAAEVMSLETALRKLHPDWDEKAVEAEAKRLEEEKASLVPPSFAEFNPNLNPPGDDTEEEE